MNEIEKALVNGGATGMAKEFDPKTKEAIAMSFRITVDGKEIPFLLPAKSESIFAILQEERSWQYRERNEEKDREQSKRTAWRQIFRWVQAQLALIDTGMVETEEVFMPYIQTGINQTAFQMFKAAKFVGLLGDGSGNEL